MIRDSEGNAIARQINVAQRIAGGGIIIWIISHDLSCTPLPERRVQTENGGAHGRIPRLAAARRKSIDVATAAGE